MPQGHGAAQPQNLLLLGLGDAPPTCPLDEANDLSGPLTAMGALPATVALKTIHSTNCVTECESPKVAFWTGTLHWFFQPRGPVSARKPQWGTEQIRPVPVVAAAPIGGFSILIPCRRKPPKTISPPPPTIRRAPSSTPKPPSITRPATTRRLSGTLIRWMATPHKRPSTPPTPGSTTPPSTTPNNPAERSHKKTLVSLRKPGLFCVIVRRD